MARGILWERLGWICDVAELIARHSLDWPALLERAAARDSERMFLLGLHLAERLLDAPLPDEVKQRCDSDARLTSLAANIVEHLFNGPTHVPATSLEIFKYNIGVRKTLSSPCPLFSLHVSADRQRSCGPLGSRTSLSFAYYLTRPFRLLFKPNQ